MTDSIPNPWIVEYLVDIAEQYGANLAAVPRKDKAAKAQLVKFLTFPPPDKDEPCALWVEISDKKHIIRARLSADAIQKHDANPAHGGKPITSRKSAFVLLKDFRPALGRVARRDGQSGMTEESTLFLDVDTIVLKGAFGEAMWGSPVDSSNDPKVRDWIHGLRQDGGAGNVLKLRKQEAAAHAAEREEFEKKAAMKPAAKPSMQTTINPAALDMKVRVARKSVAQKPKKSINDEDSRQALIPINKEVLRRAAWKRFHANMVKYFRPPDDIFEQLISLCDGSSSKSAIRVSKAAQRQQPRSRSGSPRAGTPRFSPPPRSPSHWSPSVRGSPQRDPAGDSSETEEEPSDDGMEVDDPNSAQVNGTMDEDPPDPPEANGGIDERRDEDEDAAANHSSSSLTMPPPAQPRPAPTPSDVPYATSQPQPQSQVAEPPSQAADHDLPPSSLPIPPSSLRDQLSSPLTQGRDIYQPSSVPRLGWSASEPLIRRVPPPVYSMLRPDPDASGEGRVLVENSDTASPGSQRVGMSQSQSHIQSQSQSQSQGRDEGEEERSQEQRGSQYQRPSKLRNELRHGRTRSAEREGDVHAAVTHDEEPVPVESSQGRIEGVLATEAEEEGPPALSQNVQNLSQPPSQDMHDPLHSPSQESQKSRQSLSYQGDSQSQDKTAEAPPAPSEAPVAGAEEAAVYESEEAPVTLDENLPLADRTVVHVERASPPSPMQVDEEPGSLVENVGNAPTWAAIKSAPSTDSEGADSQEEEADVDQLLSDPIDMDQRDRAPTTKTRRTGAGIQGARGQLDPDDARTAAMVDRYVSGIQKKTAKEKAQRRDGRPSAEVLASRRPTPAADEQPKARLAQRRNKGQGGPGVPYDRGVFTNEESLKLTGEDEHPSPVDSPPASKHSRHDPEVWTAPTFMRKRSRSKEDIGSRLAKANGKPQPSAVLAAGTTAVQKRPASVSPELEQEEPSTKKRKTSTAAISVSGDNAKPRLEQQQAGQRDRKSEHVSAAASGPSTLSRDRTQDLQALPKKPTQTRPPSDAASASDAGSTALNSKYLDLRAASRSSSRSSTRAPRAGTRGPVQTIPTPSEASSSTGKGKARTLTVTDERKGSVSSSMPRSKPVLPVLSGAKTVSSRGTTQRSSDPAKQGSLSTHAVPAPSGSSSGGGALVSELPPPGPDKPAEQRKSLLDGYKVSLDLVKVPGGPPLLDWNDLLHILLRTGQARARPASGASRSGGDG
ncbi:hypothetical protein BD310DRAFT_974965 [Dichomitus squalens]|uniref:Telomere replication protein EST3 n=1 Tax=Dichomitus squalens TaxID=114155 RepID=A0A4Q9Q3B3_9APHY|nr:hypothetical protein BD310DRAFT_974965 [Dichomitus squalens]